MVVKQFEPPVPRPQEPGQPLSALSVRSPSSTALGLPPAKGGAVPVSTTLPSTSELSSPAGSLPPGHSTAVNISAVASPRGAATSNGSFPTPQSTVNSAMARASNGLQAATSSPNKFLLKASQLGQPPIQKSREERVLPSKESAASHLLGHVEVAGLGPSGPCLGATSPITDVTSESLAPDPLSLFLKLICRLLLLIMASCLVSSQLFIQLSPIRLMWPKENRPRQGGTHSL